MPDTEEPRTMVLNPLFNYQQHVEILKRFVEQLDAHMGQSSAEQIDYVERNIDYVREAMREILADDIQFQIATGKFPLAKQLHVHAYKFEDSSVSKRCIANGSSLFGSCGGVPTSAAHSL